MNYIRFYNILRISVLLGSLFVLQGCSSKAEVNKLVIECPTLKYTKVSDSNISVDYKIVNYEDKEYIMISREEYSKISKHIKDLKIDLKSYTEVIDSYNKSIHKEN